MQDLKGLKDQQDLHQLFKVLKEYKGLKVITREDLLVPKVLQVILETKGLKELKGLKVL